MEPIWSFHASPMDIAPSWRGDTRTPAVGARMRCRPRAVLGSGGGAKKSAMVLSGEV
jgi:hypothetical protein